MTQPKKLEVEAIAEAALAPTTYDKLKAIRAKKDLEARQSRYLKPTFVAMDGRERPLKLRYYQVQGVMHLLAMTRFLLGDDTGLGKCKPHASLILTDAGMLTLGSLGPWKTMDPDTFSPMATPTKVWTGWEWAPIKSFYFGGVKPTRKLVTRRGYEVTGTLVHPLWTRFVRGVEEFIETRALQVGDYLALERKLVEFPDSEPTLPVPEVGDLGSATKHYTLPGQLSPDLASFLAYVVAEGNTNHYRVVVTQDRNLNQETHDHIRQLAKDLFGWVGSPDDKRSHIRVSISSTLIRSYLEGLGVDQVLSAKKTVPWPIFKGTRASVASFLRAFFDSEGSVTGAVVEVSSASEQLLRDIQILLLRFGIVCTRRPKKTKGYDHTYWRLSLCGDDLKAFRDHIGFLTPRKQEALEVAAAKASNTNLDVIPHAKELVESLRADILAACSVRGANKSRMGSGLKQFGVSFEKTLNGIRNGGRNPTYRFLREMLEVAKKVGADLGSAYKAVEVVVTNHFFYDPIVSITEGEEPVMDLEVDHPRHSFVADGFVNHNTLQCIASLCYLWEKTPTLKALVFTSKSAVEQWGGEFDRFTTGVKSFICRGNPNQRRKVREAFQAYSGPSVLVMGYSSAKQDIAELQDWEGFALILDEATAFKNHQTRTHQVCKYLAGRASRAWALTATLIKNNLLEGWGIYQVLVPTLFGNMNSFMNEYCVVRMMPIPGSRRQIPTIVGYRPKDVQAFREKIDPYFLGRPKFEVASELPPLITRHVKVDLTKFQEEKYAEALSGLLQVGTGGTGEKAEEKEVTKLTAVTYCQQIANHPELIGCDGDSSKLEALIDLLTEGEFESDRVIVFSRFRKMVDIMMPALKKAGIKAVRITGEEDEKGRKASQDLFQNVSNDIRVVCITTAAAEAINLQAAKAIVFYDTPWSAGDYLQLLGRMIRIGSTHDRCYAIHLVARGTIDDRVSQVLAKKMGLVESVLGKRIKGEDANVTVEVENDLSDLFNALMADAKALKK